MSQLSHQLILPISAADYAVIREEISARYNDAIKTVLLSQNADQDTIVLTEEIRENDNVVVFIGIAETKPVVPMSLAQ